VFLQVLYPSEDSNTVPELRASGKLPRNIIIIESPWKKATGMLERPEVQNMEKLRLQSTYSAFWRYRTNDISARAFKEGCSSIEAIYFLCRELHASEHEDGDCHCYDNLLWYFNFIHHKIVDSNLNNKPNIEADKPDEKC
jgi:hypothetical protein